MTDAAAAHRLKRDIERTGYYPELVGESLALSLGNETVRSYLVQHEATFDLEEVRRHMTVLVLTDTRLLVTHTDEHPADETYSSAYATTTSEAVPLDQVKGVVLTRVVTDPARHRPGGPVQEVVLTVGWGSMNRIDLEPATCGDPDCDADHGYTGVWSADDLSLRLSAAADGAGVIKQALSFAAALTDVTTSAAR